MGHIGQEERGLSAEVCHSANAVSEQQVNQERTDGET